jgi:hypothetical protein
MAIVHPPTLINAYLASKIEEDNTFGFALPFFPTLPSTIDQLTQTFPNLGGEAGIFAVYDRMFRMRRRAFPHIKDEQVLYYFYGTQQDGVTTLFDLTQKVADLLDREDESAEEINKWVQSELINGIYLKGEKEFLPVHFHYFRIYQLEETRDIIDFGTARTYAGNKIIIDYCYHTPGEKIVNGVRTYNDTNI